MGSEEVRPAFYALRAGGWRDYVTVVHLPYTAWNLAYVALGAALAPVFSTNRMLWTMAAFLLALGISAHALDELNGRPLGTAIPSRMLVAARGRRAGRRLRDRHLGGVDLGLGTARLRRGRRVPRPRLQPRVVRRCRSTTSGASRSPGARFPVLTAYYAQAVTLKADVVLAAGYATAMILVQRALSTPVRHARRTLGSLEGVEPMERALRILPWANILLAAALVTARLT